MSSRRTAQTRQESEEVAVRPWTASLKSRCRSLIYSEEIGKDCPDVVRRSQRSRNYKTGGMCRQQGRSTNAD
jgi:hypothetical protein